MQLNVEKNMFDYLHCKYEPYAPADKSLIDEYGIRFNMDYYFECDSKIYLGGWVYSETHQIQCVCVKARKGRFVVREQLQYAIKRLDVFENCEVLRSQKSGFIGCYERQDEDALQVEVIVDNNEVVLFEIASCDVKDEPLKIEEVSSNYLCDVYPNRNCRKYLKGISNKMRHSSGLKVFFNHDLGGGAESYLKNMIEDERVREYVVIKYNLYCERYMLEYHDGNDVYSVSFWNIESIIKFLARADISELWINNLYTYPDIYSLLKMIVDLKKKKGAKLVYPLHDYYEISPEKNLLSVDGTYKGINCTDISQVPGLGYEEIYIEEWRENWKRFLQNCDEVRCFSQASKDLLEEAYGNELCTSLVPHSMEYFDKLVRGKEIEHHVYNADENLHVGILGILTEAKGINIVKSILQKIETENLPIDITLIGNSSDTIVSSRFYQTGVYDMDKLVDIAQKTKIDIFLIPSVWPETFSYTTGEVMAMGYPVMVFDMGAPAERVRKYEKGYVVKEVSADAVCEMLLNDVR